MTGRTPEEAYLDLQKLARAQGRNTQQLFELYIHERFLARLAESRFAESFILKGGMRVRKTRKFPPEFRQEAVELYRNSDRSLEQVAKEPGIGGSTLARWHYQLGREAKQQDEPTSNERAELRRLRRENRRLKEERELSSRPGTTR